MSGSSSTHKAPELSIPQRRVCALQKTDLVLVERLTGAGVLPREGPGGRSVVAHKDAGLLRAVGEEVIVGGQVSVGHWTLADQDDVFVLASGKGETSPVAVRAGAESLFAAVGEALGHDLREISADGDSDLSTT